MIRDDATERVLPPVVGRPSAGALPWVQSRPASAQQRNGGRHAQTTNLDSRSHRHSCPLLNYVAALRRGHDCAGEGPCKARSTKESRMREMIRVRAARPAGREQSP